MNAATNVATSHWRWTTLGSRIEFAAGGVAIFAILVFLAAQPVLQLLVLGYLIEVGGRIGQTGKIRSGAIGFHPAARLGGIALGIALVLLPIRFAASMWHAARLADPTGSTARHWQVLLSIVICLAVAHVFAALWRGGRLRYFFIPSPHPLRGLRAVLRPGAYAQTRDRLWEFVVSLRVPHYFRLGLVSYAATALWLAPGLIVIALGRRHAGLEFPGGFLLAAAAIYLPFLQVHYGVEQRWTAMFNARHVHRLFRQAPLASLVGLAATLVLSVPMFLMKIELPTRDLAWATGLVFLTFGIPARVITARAYARAAGRQKPRARVVRLISMLAMIFLAVLWATLNLASQLAAWFGIWSLFEQHTFLLPWPIWRP